ncbi:MAG: class I SAM-dependent methyltransferase [Candidatus Thermoplasmatota archaeon]|nr:class I SAM-dependent methyltransferase [Candidatus Thermoplasmatota archaeon]
MGARFTWPEGFARVPDEDWTREPVQELAEGYDSVEHHGWYANLDPTVQDLAAYLEPGEILLDYSGGTGILIDRLLTEVGDASVGVVNVDSSRKFLRLALEKLGEDERVAFRHIPYIPEEKRVTTLQEALEPVLLERGVEAISSTNAIHLYYGLEGTLASWHDVLVPGGRAFVQSGNIGLPEPRPGAWIIDDTVRAIAQEARHVVAEEDRWATYRDALSDQEEMDAYEALLDKYFVPVRELSTYEEALEAAGLEILDVTHREITAEVDEWYEFLSVYHEGVLGWIGGAQKLTGEPASEQAVADRLSIMREAMDRVFDGKESFQAVWTYITCQRPA